MPKKRLSVTGKLLFTTTTKNGSSPARVSVYSAVLAEAKPDEVGVPSTALLHTFTLAEQDRILMVAPVQPNPVQQPQEQPEPKPETAKKPFKLLVIILTRPCPLSYIFDLRYASLPTKMVSRRKPTLSNLVLPHRQPHHKPLVTSKPELR